MKLLPIVVAALCLTPGCSKPDSAFVKAEVERHNKQEKAKNGKRTVTNPAEAAKLASFFNYGNAIDVAKESADFTDLNGYTIMLSDGNRDSRKLYVLEDFSAWTAGKRKNWWSVRPGVKEFVEKLFAEDGEKARHDGDHP